MEETLKISVIIPVYNTAKYLPRCLDSVLQNTYQNLEVICINDGSTDNSADILEEYVRKDSRVTAISQQNTGVSSARNVGLDQATGEYIAFVDSDDWIHPQYFEILADLADKYEADCVLCGTRTADHKEIDFERQYTKDSVKIVATDLKGVMTSNLWRTRIWGRLYNRKLLSAVRFPVNIRLTEDTCFNLSALCFKERIQVVAVDTKLYFYFQRADSAVHTLSAKDSYPALALQIDMCDRCETSHRIYIVEHIIKQALSVRYGTMFSDDKKEYRTTCNRLLRKCVRMQNSLPVKEYLLYQLFVICPFSYRLFRIVTDRTMLVWEKSEKEKNKAVR